MVSPSKMPSITLPPLVRRKIFGSGHAGLWVSSRSTARGERISMPCAASPPSAFCQEKVTTSSFGQSRFCAKHAEVASQMDRPARRGAVPGEDHVGCGIDLGEIGKLAVGGLEHCHVGELKLLRDVGHPAF